ncbi:MAG TPA: zinc ribbon domain-containing protein [Acetivibrio saccincola]|uniref:zinc ribbon domain-containing protein n=1 Tax=Acetivibrio saccincola TaxID=1677857 RepID=UPI002B8EC788|nr:zinc ribbon domain-containing protein [Acetivibrio saccincola]HOA96351.1 zinc ribbon domain-containing protein [Acetivibrio saccincola]HQD28661.1 zinc ribbon domain-containing protein [Acetivibrio saccincola]
MKKICKNCGASNQPAAKYCNNCNESLIGSMLKSEDESLQSVRPANNYASLGNDTVSIGKWLLVMFLLTIPLVNIGTLFYLAFVSQNQNLENFGKAALILTVIYFVLAIVFVIIASIFFVEILKSLSY